MFSHTAQYDDTIDLAMKDDGAEAAKLTALSASHQVSHVVVT
jgi:hypothetical protein